MLEFFMAGDNFTVMVQSRTLGLFKLRLSDFWLWSTSSSEASTLSPSDLLHTVTGVAFPGPS